MFIRRIFVLLIAVGALATPGTAQGAPASLDGPSVVSRVQAVLDQAETDAAGAVARLPEGLSAVLQQGLLLRLSGFAAEQGRVALVDSLLALLDRPTLDRVPLTRRLEARVASGDHAAATVEARDLLDSTSPWARAEAQWHLSQIALANGDTASAVMRWWRLVESAPRSPRTLPAAAAIRSNSAAFPDTASLARTFARFQRPAPTVELLRPFSGTNGSAELVELLARSELTLGNNERARRAYARLESLLSGEPAAQAAYEAARATYRMEREAGLEAFAAIADRYPGAPTSSEALFLVADLIHDTGDAERARGYYRATIANRPGHDRAGHAAMRLAGMAFAQGEFSEARRIWEGYRSEWPTGRRAMEATYWAGRAALALGDRATATARFEAVREAGPFSYYAVLASRRLGGEWAPPVGHPDAHTEALSPARFRTLDILTGLDWTWEVEREVERLRALCVDRTSCLALAEAFIDHGHGAEAMRIGWSLRADGAPWSPDLLRVLYPWPYRDVFDEVASTVGAPAGVLAGLARQESAFDRAARSPVGAVGLMQIMPQTGRRLAEQAALDAFDESSLTDPVVAIRLGGRFLGDLLSRWGGRLPFAAAAYNAGPHRVDRWEHLPEAADLELFTERIPYRETRGYVKAVVRNAIIYGVLYGTDP